jgi:hypothetical protein
MASTTPRGSGVTTTLVPTVRSRTPSDEDPVRAKPRDPRSAVRCDLGRRALERLHKEIKRRTRVIGIFPTRDSLMRMVGTLLAEQDDEVQVSDRRYSSVGSMAKVDAFEGGEDTKELLAQIA